jgi:hypothetical protein
LTLGEILNNREATEKITKWAIELSMYGIIYKLRTTIMAQALSDFVAEWIETQTPPRESFKYVLQMHFPVSNKAAEYEALLHGLRMATTLIQGSWRLTARCQSGQQRVVMSRRQNDVLLLRAQQVRKQF